MLIKWLAGPMDVGGVGLMETGEQYEVSDKIGADLIAEDKAEAVGTRRKTKDINDAEAGASQNNDEGDD